MKHLLTTFTLAVAAFASSCATPEAATAPTTMSPAAAPTVASAESHPIDRVAWLAGRWIGQGLGGDIEETWAPPAGGQMVGHFQLVRDGAVAFYELLLLDVAEGGVRMRVKHFEPDFVAWEQPGDWHAFEPVSVGADEIAFDGFTIRRVAADEIVMRLTLRYEDGAREEVLRLSRAPL